MKAGPHLAGVLQSIAVGYTARGGFGSLAIFRLEPFPSELIHIDNMLAFAYKYLIVLSRGSHTGHIIRSYKIERGRVAVVARRLK
jgi:hypothetical protein